MSNISSLIVNYYRLHAGEPLQKIDRDAIAEAKGHLDTMILSDAKSLFVSLAAVNLLNAAINVFS